MQVDLTRQKWTLRGYRPNYWQQRRTVETDDHWQPDIGPIPARVPGSAQTALRAAGWLPDWNVGLNSLKCEWVEHRQWEFRTRLKPMTPTLRESVILHCDGLDYSGVVAIDTKIVGRFRGALVRHRFDLTDAVADGKPHTLSIIFEPSPQEQGQVGATSKSEFFKPRYNYSWDWCPRFVPAGIWDRLWIEWSPPRPRVIKVLTSLAEDLRTGRVNVFFENEGDEAAATVTLRRNDSQIATSRQAIPRGEHVVRLDNVQVEPWFPNGHGRQPLYELNVASAGEEIDRRSVGFKRVRWLPNEGAPATARPMVCEVNGEPIFLQGVNWTPIRMDYHDTPPAEYRARINLYKKMGCNVLRVWGGAFLEREIFYDLCDRAGILVWQEFPLSSSGHENYAPEKAEAIKELEKISTDYIRRRGHHACKLLWCGGNELQTLPNEKGEQFPLTESHPALAALKRVVEREDPETRYLPTSPAGPIFYATPETIGSGIHHHVHGPWNHFGPFESAEEYWSKDDTTFRSETGMPGAQSLKLMKKYSGGCDLWPPTKDNPLWVHSSLWWLPKDRFKRELRGLQGAARMKKFVQLSQDFQSRILELAAGSCKERFPRCAGFIIWMGHDCFPCLANTSIIDVEGNPKPAYHAVAKVFRRRQRDERISTTRSGPR